LNKISWLNFNVKVQKFKDYELQDIKTEQISHEQKVEHLKYESCKQQLNDIIGDNGDAKPTS